MVAKDYMAKSTMDCFWRKDDVGFRFIDNDNSIRAEFVIYQYDDEGHESCYTVCFIEWNEHEHDVDVESVGRRLVDALKEYHLPYDEFVSAIDNACDLVSGYFRMKAILKS